ncbi:MAG: polyprenyl synthetase family protein [Candidatus Margulisiibacteriota bacterium]
MKEYLIAKRKLVDQTLDRALPKKGHLAEAIRYSIFAGGKRFRPILCLATAAALGGSEKKVLPYACAVEMIHTFTLIHDDLPAMDNSDFRRGKPSNHKVYGEALAILAGDALSALAFKEIADQPAALLELSTALLEVVAGQVADIEAPNKPPTVKAIRSIHKWKTAALLRACVRGTALICGAESSVIKDLTKYAEHLGLAFQIADDILDTTATKKQLGKPVRADVKKGYPYFFGLDRSQELAAREKTLAVKALDGFGPKVRTLVGLAGYVVERTF